MNFLACVLLDTMPINIINFIINLRNIFSGQIASAVPSRHIIALLSIIAFFLILPPLKGTQNSSNPKIIALDI